MRNIVTETVNGPEVVSVYEINELPLLGMLLESKDSKKRDVTYIELISTFDIETTAIYKRNEDFTISNEIRPYAFMYHWQFSIGKDGEYVVFGRTWEEFQKLLKTLERGLDLRYDRRLVIWVHNLSYEWAFMRQFIDYADGFFLEERQPLKIVTKGGIEFRCSYKLSNMSLQKFCENEENVRFYKLSGDSFDYNKIRYPNTWLTPEEESYCYNDVRGLAECIRSRLKTETLAKIPMTSTGYVRRDMRNAFRTNSKNRDQFIANALTPELYTICRKAFRGGDTHANIYYSDCVLKRVQSFDIASSYPFEILTGLYPVTRFCKMPYKKYRKLKDKSSYAFIGYFRFENIRYIGECNIPYIAFAKCEKISKDKVIDNGRILKADFIECWLTDIDFNIINNEYLIDSIKVSDLHVARYGELPREVKEVCLDYYRKKTTLKGVEGKEYEYGKSKNKLNATYGCMVMRIDREMIRYNPLIDEYVPESKSLEALISTYYSSRNNFLSYQWGVWITANARKSLREGLNMVGRDVIYCDTDSVKCLNDHRADFDKLNAARIAKAIEHDAFAKDVEGNTRYAGVWEYEGTYEKFSTLGAKKYVYQKDGKISSTIAGVSKKAGKAFFKKYGFDGFKIGNVIRESGHLTAFYNDVDIYTIKAPDGLEFTSASNVALVDNTYTIGVTNEYLDLLYKAKHDILNVVYQ